MIVSGRDKVDECLCLGTQRGMEEISVVSEGLNGASRDELCIAAAALHLTR